MKLEELAEKLAEVSFYEDKRITRTAEGWEMEDDYLYAEAEWTYPDGIEYYGTNDETRVHTGLQDPYGRADKGFILYHFREALEAMKEGDELSFAYFIVYDFEAALDEDEIAGWSVAMW